MMQMLFQTFSYLCVIIDYKKAYDRVNHHWLQFMLEKAGIPPMLLKAIMTV